MSHTTTCIDCHRGDVPVRPGCHAVVPVPHVDQVGEPCQSYRRLSGRDLQAALRAMGCSPLPGVAPLIEWSL